MATMYLIIPDELKAFAEAQAVRAGHSTVNEYVTALLRDAERQAALSRLEEQLLHSLDGPSREISEKDWDAMDKRFEERQPTGRRP